MRQVIHFISVLLLLSFLFSSNNSNENDIFPLHPEVTLDDIKEGTPAPDTLLAAQADADASQKAAVASIEAAAQSAMQVTLAAEANNLVAAKNYQVALTARVGAAAREAARVEAAIEDLLSAKAAANAAYNQALAAQADAQSSKTAAESRLADVRAAISAAASAEKSSAAAGSAAKVVSAYSGQEGAGLRI